MMMTATTTAVDNNNNNISNSINSSLLKKIKKMNEILTDVVGAGSSSTTSTNTTTTTPPQQIIRRVPLTHLTSTSTINTSINTSLQPPNLFITTPKQKRINMINNEIDIIIDNLKDYFGYHMMDELFVTDDIKIVLLKAAMNLAYNKIYYCPMKDKIIYFPSCKELILNYKLMEEAEKYYYDTEDEFPIEYSKGLRTVVSTSSSSTATAGGFQKMIDNKKGSSGNSNDEEEKKGSGSSDEDDDDDDSSIIASDINNNNNSDNDNDEEDKLGSDIIERLAMSWREALDEETS